MQTKPGTILSGLAALVLIIAAGSAWAVDFDRKVTFSISSQPLSAALVDFSNQARIQVMSADAELAQRKAREVKGSFSVRDALARLLEGTDLVYSSAGENTIAVLRKSEEKTGEEIRLSRVEAAPAQGMRKVDTSAEDQSEGDEGEEKPAAASRKTGESSGEITVTGSRIATTPSQMAANVIVLDAEALRATGQSTLEGALRQLPQNIYGATEVGAVWARSGMSFNGAINVTGGSSINLRGLGSESTLVLIDGRRMGKSGLFGGISDISAIPLRSIERVEIMLDGASAIYGSDAVGGVVNIILKKDYDDAEITYEYGAPQVPGFDEHVLTLSGGTSWDSGGRVRATFERFQRSDLDGAERPERIYRSQYQFPPLMNGIRVYEYNGQRYLLSELTAAGLTPGTAGVQSFGFLQFPADWDGVSELSADDFAAPSFYDPDASDGISLIPTQRRHSLQVNFDQRLPWFGGGTTLSGSAYYSDRQTRAAQGSFTFSPGFHILDPANPLPDEGSVVTTLYWRIPGLADKRYETDQQVARWQLALDGEVGESWRWEVAAGQSRDRIDSLYIGNAIPAAYFSETYLDYLRGFGYTEEQLETLLDYRFTELVDAGLNVFTGDIAGANDPALLAQLVEPPQPIAAINRESTLGFSASGSLFALPGGDVHLAVGADWREASLESRSDGKNINQFGFGSYTGSNPNNVFDAEVDRVVRSVFTEILLPLVGSGNSMTGVERLSLTGAARYDSYNWYPGDSTWSAGVIWNPIDQVRIKANKSTSYVVPTPREALMQPFVNAVNGTSGPNFYDEFGNFLGQDADVRFGTVTSGGNPDLQPETASTVSAGVEFAPETIPGLSLSAIWHETIYNNRIGGAPSPQFIVGTDYVSKYPNLTLDDETGWLNYDLRAINFALVEAAGVDYRLRYNRETAFGHFVLTANVGYTSKFERTEIAGEAPINEVANVGFQSYGVIPAYRYSLNLGRYHRGLSVNLDASTSSKTVSTGGTTTVLQRVGKAAVQTDLLLAYDFEQGDLLSPLTWLEKTEISLKILNVLNDRPEYQINNLTTGEPHDQPELNSNLADPRGRMFYLGITKRF